MNPTQKSIFRHGKRKAIKLGLRKWMTSKRDMHQIHLEQQKQQLMV